MLDGKTMFVTGGSRGIGAAIVRRAMEDGAQVAFTYKSQEGPANALARELTALYPGQECVPFACDVADTASMEDVAQKVLARFGRLDALVNNAAITKDGVLARMSRQQWDDVIGTNLTGLYNATKPFLLSMIKGGGGSIISIGSITAVYGFRGQTNYAASKGGMMAFTKALSAEVASQKVRVNAVAPGYIQTDMSAAMTPDVLEYVKTRISLGRLGRSEDVAPLVSFLASDLSSYITGQIILVDGGIHL